LESFNNADVSWDAVAQRYRDANGKFAPDPSDADEADTEDGVDDVTVADGDGNANETASAEDTAKDAVDTDEATDEATAEASEETSESVVRITLPGDPQRDEEDLDIEVTDPAVADRLARLKNDGLRRNEFQRRMKDVTAKESEIKAIEIEMATNPVGFLLERLAPARQLDVARALIAQNFEALAPDIEKYWTDEAERKLTLAEIKESMIEARRAAEAQTAQQHQVMQVVQTVHDLIPEQAPESDAEEFRRLSLLHLEAISRERGAIIRPDEVPTLLASLRSRYGFHQTGTTATPASASAEPSPATPRIAVARPVGENAKALAERAKAAQQRRKVVRAQRENAAAIAPPGAGAMPIERPKPPAGADVKQASAWLRQHLTSNRWASPS